MRTALPLLLLLLSPLPALGQARYSAGLSLGSQSQEGAADDPKTFVGGELLAEGRHFGLHAAVDVADFAFAGNGYATHVDVVYRARLSRQWSLRLGTGPTYVSVGDYGSETTWNAMAEVAFSFGRAEAFARVRQYDYEVDGFRDFVSPSGPAVSVGARFRIGGGRP